MKAFKDLRLLFVKSESNNFIFLLSISFYLSLLFVSSNKIYLALTLLYLIILLIKLQNWKLSLWLTSIALLTFTKGRNLLEIVLIPKEEIWGLSLYDVKYYWPIYLGDIFLLLFYQNYFSNKLSNKNIKTTKTGLNFKIASTALFFLFTVVLSKSINHQFAGLLIFSSFLILKYFLLFASPLLLKCKNKFKNIKSVITASVLFQSILIFAEQIKGDNLGKYIENSSPFNLFSAEASNVIRANGSFNEPNIAAIYLLMGLALIFPAAIKSLKSKKYSHQLLASSANILAIIFTGSRSLYLLTAIYLFWQFKKNKLFLKKYLIDLWHKKIIKFATLLIISIIIPYLGQRLKNLKNTLIPTGSISYRLELNRYTWALAKEKLFLGIGIDLTPYYLAKNFKTSDSVFVNFDQAPAHNLFVQLMAETGVAGLFFFIVFVFACWRQSFKKKNWFENEWLIASLIYLVGAQLHPVFSNHSELTGFFFLFCGLSLEKSIKNAKK